MEPPLFFPQIQRTQPDMKTILISSLTIPPNRQRRQFNEAALDDLANSIQSKGLLHPLVLRDDHTTLVAGERRLRAITLLNDMGIRIKCDGTSVPLHSIPIITIGDLSDLDVREAELEENIIRKDLTWQERSVAVAALHNLRVDQLGEYDRWNNPEGRTVGATAEEVLGGSGGQFTKNIQEARIIAQHLDDPLVASANSQKEAIKVIKKKATREMTALLADLYSKQETKHEILHGDATEILPTLPSATFSVLCTDPPYGVDAHTFGDMADATHEYDDSFDNYTHLTGILAKESYRLCTKRAHAYVFCDIRHWSDLAEIFRGAGWNPWSVPIIWAKGNGMLPKPHHGPRRTYEAILFASKGDREVTGVHPDTIEGIRTLSTPAFGAEKPAALFRNLLQRSCLPGDHILDPFAGAGPIIPACNYLSLTATTIELSQEKHNHILTRLEETIE